MPTNNLYIGAVQPGALVQSPYSLSFNGSSGKVTSAFSLSTSSLPTLTLACWIKTSTTSSGMDIFGCYPASSQDVELYLNAAGKLEAFVRDTGSHAINPSGSIVLKDGQWHHVAMVLSGTTVTLYVDGSPDGNATNGSFTGNVTGVNPLAVGTDSNGGNWFNGLISDPAVWLSDHSANIAGLAVGTKQPWSLAPVAYWPFLEGNGGQTAGRGSNGTDTPATLTSGATWSTNTPTNAKQPTSGLWIGAVQPAAVTPVGGSKPIAAWTRHRSRRMTPVGGVR